MWALLSLLLICASAQQPFDCPVYACAPPTTNLGENVCLKQMEGNYWMSLCPGFSNEFGCVKSDIPGKSFYCGIIPPPEVEPSYPGEPCELETDCIGNHTNSCIEGMCTGFGVGKSCAHDYDCGLGFYCDQTNEAEGTCQFQLEEGDPCTSEYQCLNFLGCTGFVNQTGPVPGKCIPYYSLPIGHPVSTCVDNDGEGSNRLCVSSTCLRNGPGIDGPGVCIAGYVGAGIGAKNCTKDSDCTGFSVPSFYTTKSCQCGMSSGNTTYGYCPLFSGDQVALGILQFTQSLLLTNMSDCHTSHRFNDFCFEKYLHADVYASYLETLEYATNFELYQNNDNCVKGNLLNDFYQLSAQSFECPAYGCFSDLNKTDCIAYNQGNNTYELKACLGADVCDLSQLDNNKNGTCSPPPAQNGFQYPGDNCTANSQCMSNNCTSNTCVGVQSGQQCSDSTACDVGLYCSNFVCTALLQAGSKTTCYSDSDCALNAGCNMTASMMGTCVEYFSMQNGGTVFCPDSGFQPMCQSAMCANTKGFVVGTCVTAAQSNTPVTTCHYDSDCTDSTNTYTSKCYCGYNNFGFKYCSLFPGDPVFTTYLTALKPTITNTNSANTCQTTRRFQADCLINIQRQLNDNTNALLAYFYNATMFPLLQRNDACVQQIFTNEYWSINLGSTPINNNTNNTNNTSTGIEFAAAGVMWLTFG